jgi:hypothetical protein
MDDIHDQLVKAYLDYFKANEWWERKRSVRAYYAVQKSIREIKELATMRNREVREQHQSKSDSSKK